MEDILKEPLVAEQLRNLLYLGKIYTAKNSIVYKSQFNGRYVVAKMKKYPSSRRRREASNHFVHRNAVELIHSFEIEYSGEEWIEVLVLELMETDLRAEINRRRNADISWSEDEVLLILMQVVDALARAQERGISHRDIKPGNILKTGNIYKIADFNFARDITYDPSTVVGTPDYFSPLQRQASANSESQITHDIVKSDVYSLGLTILALNYPGQFKFTYFQMRTKPFEIIRNLPYQEGTKNMLRNMLAFDENERWDFLQLEEYLKTRVISFSPDERDNCSFTVDSRTESSSVYDTREVSGSISMGVDKNLAS